MIIRKANIFDHGAILNLSVKWFDEIKINGFPGPSSYSGIWLADLIANHLFMIAEYEEKIVGALGLRVSYMPWNIEEKVLMNEVFMTDEAYRNKNVAGRLLDSIKEFCKDNDLFLIMGHMTGMDAELKDRYLSIQGFRYAGANFIFGRQ